MSTEVLQSDFRKILGLNFFSGSADKAVELMCAGGLLVVPAAPSLKDLPHDRYYREALLNADLVITDSAFMVLLWNFLQHDSVRRLSGLEYLRALIPRPEFREPGQTFWVMAKPSSAEKNIAWLKTQGIHVGPDDYYVAPFYEPPVKDPQLIELLKVRRPKHIVVTVGGGKQEGLGLYLKRELDYKPAIHCIGAAIAFLSRDQVHIPNWADHFYLGWLLRCISDPKTYGPRYWAARHLMPLVFQYRERLPDLRS